MKAKKFLALLLALAMLFTLAACGAAREENAVPTRLFTDSAGRTVEVPAQIDKVALSGPLAQIVLFSLCPDKLVGVANAWSQSAAEFLDEKYLDLPQLGQLYGGKGELNLETLLKSGAQVVIDVGESKDSIKEDMDDLQQQTGIPFVHISADMQTYPQAYRMLGDLLGMKAEAEALAAYCEKIYDRTVAVAAGVEKANVLYVTGDMGQNVIAKGSYHAEILDLLTNNLAQVDTPSSKGTGNEVSMEQILTWNPEVVLFAPESIYSLVQNDPAWQSVAAIQNGTYYEVPCGPYNWMGFPPSVQRYLGMMWLSKLLYPAATADWDLFTEVREYYKLFYHCDITRAQYDAMVANSIGK